MFRHFSSLALIGPTPRYISTTSSPLDIPGTSPRPKPSSQPLYPDVVGALGPEDHGAEPAFLSGHPRSSNRESTDTQGEPGQSLCDSNRAADYRDYMD